MKLIEFASNTTKEERREIIKYFKNKKKKFVSPKAKKITDRNLIKNKTKAIKYAKILKSGTKAELILKQIFDEDGVIYEFQKPFYTNESCYIADFYFKNIYGKRYIIELDGSSHVGNKEYDTKRTKILNKKHGCYVIRFCY